MAHPLTEPRHLSRTQKLRQSFWGHAERIACVMFRHLLSLKSRSMNEEFKSRSALVLAPHADDETLGCGGIIALKRQSGTPVYVVIATDGSASHGWEHTVETIGQKLIDLREKETRAACEILGVEPASVQFFGFKDSKLADHIVDLGSSISALIHQVNPSEIYVCAQRDGHPDHAALAEATHRAVQDLVDAQIDVFEYPVWSFDFRSWRPVGKTNTKGFLHGLRDMMGVARLWRMRSVDVSSVLQIKSTALAAHKSQLGTYPPEPEWSALPDAFVSHFLTRKEVFRRVPRTKKARE